jgi:hypothetical protein
MVSFPVPLVGGRKPTRLSLESEAGTKRVAFDQVRDWGVIGLPMKWWVGEVETVDELVSRALRHGRAEGNSQITAAASELLESRGSPTYARPSA